MARFAIQSVKFRAKKQAVHAEAACGKDVLRGRSRMRLLPPPPAAAAVNELALLLAGRTGHGVVL